jgi:hypothetical protein
MSQEDLEDRIRALEQQMAAVRLSALESLSFAFEGRDFHYVSRSPNRTWDNERAVELPIVWDAVSAHANAGDTLEVGNVLRNYFPIKHQVVDKYEVGTGVINEDVVDFQPAQPKGLVVSISTLEHVGYSESSKQPEKFGLAVENATSWLRPGGRLLFTVPLGYNPVVDEWIANPPPGLGAKRAYMKRTSANNLWQQVGLSAVRGAEYGKPFPCANALAIVSITRNAPPVVAERKTEPRTRRWRPLRSLPFS